MSEAKTSQLKGRQSTAISPGEANNQNKIILPANDTASLAQITNEVASIAYDTDQQAIVINDGTGFQPVTGGGGGANTELSNLDNPTAINQNLTFGVSNGNILAADTVALLATDNNGSSISVGDGYVELYSGQNGDANIFMYANAVALISDDGSTAPILNLTNGAQTESTGIQAKVDLSTSYTLILPEDTGAPGQALVTDGNSPAQLSWDNPTAAAAGNDGNIQFNDNGGLGASDFLSWEPSDQSLSIEGASGSSVYNLQIKGDYQQILLDHNYAGDPNARSWSLVTNNPNSGEIALLNSVDDTSPPTQRVWSLDNNHEMFMWQNDKWFYQRNTANNGFVGMIKVDASDRIVINDSPTSIEIDGAVGDLTISAATSIKLQDGSEGTAGQVWTSTDTDGSGSWQPAASSGATGARVNIVDAASSPGGFTQCVFDTTVYDTASYVSGNTFVAPANGLYLLQARAYTSSPSPNAYIVMGYSVNSATSQTEFGYIQASDGSTFLRLQCANDTLNLTAGDVVRVFYLSTEAVAGQHASITKL